MGVFKKWEIGGQDSIELRLILVIGQINIISTMNFSDEPILAQLHTFTSANSHPLLAKSHKRRDVLMSYL
jgi:hypothetical protein